MSELLPISGIENVGPLPAAVQKITVFPERVTTESRKPLIATQLLRFLASPEVAQAVENKGLHLCLKGPARGTLRRSSYCSPRLRSRRFCLGVGAV